MAVAMAAMERAAASAVWMVAEALPAGWTLAAVVWTAVARAATGRAAALAGWAAGGAESWPEERAVVLTMRAGVAAEVCAARKGGIAWRREGGGVRQPRVAALTRGSGAVALARRPRVPEQTLSSEGGGREREARGGAD